MKPLAVLLLLCLTITVGHTQCADIFEVNSIQKATQAGNDGKIEVRINTTRDFVCELHAYTNANRTRIAEKSGRGSSTVVFDRLNNTDFYRITVTFPNENDPFCQTRVIDQILLTGNKRTP